MEVVRFQVGQRFFQAAIFKNGRDIDDGTGDAFTTREEAAADGQAMVANYDPEWQKRHPGSIEYFVREYEVLSVGENGELGAAHTVD